MWIRQFGRYRRSHSTVFPYGPWKSSKPDKIRDTSVWSRGISQFSRSQDNPHVKWAVRDSEIKSRNTGTEISSKVRSDIEFISLPVHKLDRNVLDHVRCNPNRISKWQLKRKRNWACPTNRLKILYRHGKYELSTSKVSPRAFYSLIPVAELKYSLRLKYFTQNKLFWD